MKELDCDCDCDSTFDTVQEYKLELTADDREQLIRDKIQRAMHYVRLISRLKDKLDQ